MKINWLKVWQEYSHQKYFFLEFSISTFFLIFIMIVFSKFTQFVELREGMIFQDPFLVLFNTFDFTTIIFILIYTSIAFAFFILLSFPINLMDLIQSYFLMVLVRMIMMYLLPLAPPDGMVLLKDTFVEVFGSGRTLVNDLFFSGHTATMFLLFLNVPRKWKGLYFAVTVSVALLVLLQKVHYSVDVLVAPFVSFGCYYVVHNRLIQNHIKRLQ